jgi:hypothetical protein
VLLPIGKHHLLLCPVFLQGGPADGAVASSTICKTSLLLLLLLLCIVHR